MVRKVNIKIVYLFNSIIFIFYIFALQSCKIYHNTAYFTDISDSVKYSIKAPHYNSLKIESGDMLSISIMTIDPAANSIFNQGAGSANIQTGGVQNSVSGTNSNQLTNSSIYTVDSLGNIQLPLLGVFKAAGLSTDSLRFLLQEKTEQYYTLPTVIVRFANFKINILGEVLRPGSYIMTNEKNTILDALAMAGDLTIYGKRENVLLIRDSCGSTNMLRFNLNTKKLMSSPFYYLKQNDVIYVEPESSKIATMDAEQTRRITITTAITTSVLTLIIILASRIK